MVACITQVVLPILVEVAMTLATPPGVMIAIWSTLGHGNRSLLGWSDSVVIPAVFIISCSEDILGIGFTLAASAKSITRFWKASTSPPHSLMNTSLASLYSPGHLSM